MIQKKEITDDINKFIKKYREYYEKYNKIGENVIAINFLKRFLCQFHNKQIKPAFNQLLEFYKNYMIMNINNN